MQDAGCRIIRNNGTPARNQLFKNTRPDDRPDRKDGYVCLSNYYGNLMYQFWTGSQS